MEVYGRSDGAQGEAEYLILFTRVLEKIYWKKRLSNQNKDHSKR